MLITLSIKNYALIDQLNVTFNGGFSIITGETGAGKSILLGGLALILGKRADLSSLKRKDEKCIIEGEFDVANYKLTSFFEEHDLDFEERTIIRREILPNGKSRAFINDTPTTLSVLSALGEQLIDIHSQHQTLQLAEVDYQFAILDTLADNTASLVAYASQLKKYKGIQKKVQYLELEQAEAQKQYDYNAFLYSELKAAKFKEDEQETLEEQLEKLNNMEEIAEQLSQAQQLTDADEIGLRAQLNSYHAIASKLSKFSHNYSQLFDRINSMKIELEDIASEMEAATTEIDFSPAEIQQYNDRLQLLYDLYKKHQVDSIAALHQIESELKEKVSIVENGAEQIAEEKMKLNACEKELNVLAKRIHEGRRKAIPVFVKKMEALLGQLEMPNTRFKLELIPQNQFFHHGKDELSFTVSTNKGGHFEVLKKVASGGEMSRIMLAVKHILSQYAELPTIIFDEIDTGVSGEVSNRIAAIMASMSDRMQVIAITHLPQIAARGTYHYKVYKVDNEMGTETNIIALNPEERTEEVAMMLSGKKLTDSAILHAKQLLNQ
ncbi:DNA repair protein RecN [Flavobacteriaceae bacterium F08102]|nr:DNA repair protein RecN [Flavobacteriaceae bacterium F08102]